MDGNAVALIRPNPVTGYALQQTANMNGSGGGWTDVSQTPIVNGTNQEVTLTATGAFCMFRLRKPRVASNHLPFAKSVWDDRMKPC